MSTLKASLSSAFFNSLRVAFLAIKFKHHLKILAVYSYSPFLGNMVLIFCENSEIMITLNLTKTSIKIKTLQKKYYV